MNKQKFPDTWDLKTKVEFLQRTVLVNSVLYYQLNDSKMSDKRYDEISRELLKLQSEYGDISDTQYGYAFDEFDATTGFDLYSKLNDYDKERIMSICNAIRW